MKILGSHNKSGGGGGRWLIGGINGIFTFDSAGSRRIGGINGIFTFDSAVLDGVK
ncbi:hypothetical protein [Paenibacillus tianjinensis]|uniref:Uncharacterized protein n=1 Tax=Paenibacillus tianjinensis TaxID=2810347 RepID=A0ABX7L9U5_9BACL|nr:hypothetical protein [Paenibacillus tianjinensis]QSF44141.1 hypothetical protein JRJ22_23415 [Paenibacillus tianjinensis]